jgi:hypothetical protein
MKRQSGQNDRPGLRAYLIFYLIFFPCCFAFTWLRQLYRSQNPPVGWSRSYTSYTWSNHEIAIFSLVITVVAGFIVVPKLPRF